MIKIHVLLLITIKVLNYIEALGRSLDYFDQKAESIELNINMIFTRRDEYLRNIFGKIDYISDKSEIRTPDVELI